ncbi:MAG: HDOD domain-containing protein [bacterium]
MIVVESENELKAVGYICSYKTNDTEKLYELKIQTDKIKEFCNSIGIELVKVYEEPLESRPDYKPSLARLIYDSSKGGFNKVVILHSENLGSDVEFVNWVKTQLIKNKVTITLIKDTPVSTPIKNTAINPQEKIDRIKLKLRDIPSLPEVVTRVMELVQDPNSSAAQLSRVISHDPGLTSRVLRLVNSAYYGFPKQISSIQHAIMILGFTTMRGLVLSSSIFKIFAQKTDGIVFLDYKKFWKHSLVTAIASKEVAKFLYFQQDDDIFSAAILHDIGKIILDQYDHENYINVLKTPLQNRFLEQVIPVEEEFCGVNHCDVGNMVAETWNLPESISNVVMYHHDPLKAGKFVFLTSMVYIANLISTIIIDDLSLSESFFNKEVLEYLRIDIDDVGIILSKVIEETSNIDDLESFFK